MMEYHGIIPFGTKWSGVGQSSSAAGSKQFVAYNTHDMTFLVFGVKETRKSINTINFLYFDSETPL